MQYILVIFIREKKQRFSLGVLRLQFHSFNIMKNISAMYGGLVSTNDKNFFDYANQEMNKFKSFPYLKYLNQCFIFLY